MKSALLTLCLVAVLSALLMDGEMIESDAVRSLDDIKSDIAGIERDCRFLFSSDVVSSQKDHERLCPSNGPCVCGVYSFPAVRDLKAKLLADSNPDVGISKRTTIDFNDRNIVIGMKNFNNVFLTHSTTNPKILSAAFSIDPAVNAMIGTRGWLTASYNFIERVLLKCSSLFKELIRFCTKQSEKNDILKAENNMLEGKNTTLNAENATLKSEIQVLKSRIAELEARTVSSVPTDGIAPVPSVPIDGAAPAADVPPVPTDGAPPMPTRQPPVEKRSVRGSASLQLRRHRTIKLARTRRRQWTLFRTAPRLAYGHLCPVEANPQHQAGPAP